MSDLIHYYDKNKIGRDFVVGDIHGCFSQLEDGLLEINFDYTKDRLFSVGDLTDRGTESERAYEFITKDWFYPVQGNHERMIIQEQNLHIINGGEWFLNYSLKEEYRRLVTKLPIVIKVGDNLICHSLIPFSIRIFRELELMLNDAELSEKLIDYIQWNRDPTPIVIEDIKNIYAGHTINKEVTNYGQLINLDTGAFLKYDDEYDFGKLTIKEITWV